MAKKHPPLDRPVVLFTCEHGGCEIPVGYERLFRGAKRVLKSHRGWDPGALELARHLHAAIGSELFEAETSRLFVELNRSLLHPALFSEFTRELPLAERQAIIHDYYLPYRMEIEEFLGDWISRGYRVLHISVHTFTPKLDGQVREADIGLLFDPARRWETESCRSWRMRLQAADAKLRVRDNYPYLGTDDGLTTYFRHRFPTDTCYAGIELEVNQAWPLGKKLRWQWLQEVLAQTLAS
jgi:predicted N-formylglutamate amidohydrolase